MELDISLEADWPDTTDWETLALRAAEAIAAHAPELVAGRMPLPGDLFEADAPPLRRAA